MSKPMEGSDSTPPVGPRDKEAATWLWRIDRDLAPDEQDAFFDWLAAHPENATALARQRAQWERLNRLAAWRPEHGSRPNRDLLAPHPSGSRKAPFWYAIAGVAAAACIALMAVFVWKQVAAPERQPVTRAVALQPEVRRVLEDGSVVKLNDGAEVRVLYSGNERRVELSRGEAFFIVEKDPERPFLVNAGGVDVRAIGTSFNVRLAAENVEVLVAEGKVEVALVDAVGAAHASMEDRQPREPRVLVGERERARVDRSARSLGTPIEALSQERIRDALAWQHSLMTFESRTLADILEELNRLNEVQLVIGDAELGSLRFSGTFRSDNAEAFARLLEHGFGIDAIAADGGRRIVLRLKKT